MTSPAPQEPVESRRCVECFRPREVCFCDAIAQIENRTSVVILQHRRERRHPFNTARLVRQSLANCRLLVGHNAELAERFAAMPLSENVGLLFPGEDAKVLSDLQLGEHPDQLVVPDGTWHHVKTLMRDVPRLGTLRRFCLRPENPGRYRIRREPTEQSLSTLEATQAALMAIEPDTRGLDGLIDVFDRMIETQMRNGKSNWRANKRRRRGSPNVPRVLSGDLGNIVVAYGEQEQSWTFNGDDGNRRPLPVVWKAVRLVSGEAFHCVIESPSLSRTDFVELLRVSGTEIASAVSLDEFRRRWKAFLRSSDHIAVRLPSTAQMLKSADADFAATILLKSINLPIESMQDADQIDTHESRAAQRLQHAVRIVESLHRQSTKTVD